MSTIAIIDYGMGNLHSIAKAVEHVAPGERVRVSSRPADILAADRVIFPGVGGIGHTMDELARTGLGDTAREASVRTPMLCICVGMQALFERSEENNGTRCLGLVDGEVRRFPDDMTAADGARLKVPHITQDRRFYFVHSYYTEPVDTALVAGTADYGRTFCCALARENLFAVQFHPEKSQRAGLKLLENFSRWDGQI